MAGSAATARREETNTGAMPAVMVPSRSGAFPLTVWCACFFLPHSGGGWDEYDEGYRDRLAKAHQERDAAESRWEAGGQGGSREREANQRAGLILLIQSIDYIYRLYLISI